MQLKGEGDPMTGTVTRTRKTIRIQALAAATALSFTTAGTAPAHALDLGGTLSALLGLLGGNTLEDVADVAEQLVEPGGVLATIEAEINLQAAAIVDLDVDLGALRGSLDIVEAYVAGLVTITGTHTAQIAVLDDTVAGHGVTLGVHGGQIAVLQAASVATAATLLDHETRLDSLDARLGDGLASLGAGLSAVNARVDRANEGVAMAMALKSPYVPADKTFALSGGWGTFEGENAFGMAGAVRANDYLQFDAGVAFGAGHSTVGGRVGATLAW